MPFLPIEDLNLAMRLPFHAIDSFQHSCLEDIDQIWSFMEQKTSEELRSRHSIRILGGLRHTLQLQFNHWNAEIRRKLLILCTESSKKLTQIVTFIAPNVLDPLPALNMHLIINNALL